MKTSFDHVARAHADRLYRMGLGFCGNHADAQDLAQETLLNAFRAWDRFEGRADPATWLYRIAARTCQRMRRRRAGQPAQLESIEADPAFSERLMVDLDALARRADEGDDAGLERMREAIAALPAAFRLPLVLKELAGLSIEEAAVVLGLKPATVKTRLHRARMMLRKKLVKELPLRPGVDSPFARQVCLDLLAAKQEALDRGVPFPVQDGLVCERCRSVFATLDAGQEMCQRLASASAPASLRALVRNLAGSS